MYLIWACEWQKLCSFCNLIKNQIDKTVHFELSVSRPVIWNIKSKDFHNKTKREVAYKILINDLEEIKPIISCQKCIPYAVGYTYM